MLHHLVGDVLWPAQKGQQEEIGMSGAAAVAGGEEGGLGVRACGAMCGAASWTGQQMVGNTRLVDRADDIICARGHKEGSLEPAEAGGAVGTLAAVAGKQALFRHRRHFLVQLRRVWGGRSATRCGVEFGAVGAREAGLRGLFVAGGRHGWRGFGSEGGERLGSWVVKNS
jgi:hypothetical protein